MTAVTATASEQQQQIDPEMKGPLAASAILHSIVILLAIFGLPYIKKDNAALTPPIPVEIMTVDKITQTDKAPSLTRTEAKDEAKPSPKEPPKPVAPKVTSAAPPKLTAPTPPELAEDVAIPKPTKKTPPPKTPPKETPKETPNMAKAEDEEQKTFESLLRNLAPDAPEKTEVAEDATETPTPAAPAPMAPMAAQMTISELDSVRQQLSQCWNMMAGTKYAENLSVEITMFMNPDRTVRDARVVDQGRYNRDTYFRAAADSALRAIFNPHCNPMTLPPDKYDQWKEMTINFDPREMLQ